jgi:hypothetical protein
MTRRTGPAARGMANTSSITAAQAASGSSSWAQAQAEVTHVAVAANFTEPAKEIAALFKQKTGHEAVLVFKLLFDGLSDPGRAILANCQESCERSGSKPMGVATFCAAGLS